MGYEAPNLGLKPADDLVAEDVAIVVGAAFSGHPHRLAYRTALDEHDLLVHPIREPAAMSGGGDG